MTPMLHSRQLLTIICEADIERQLVSDLYRLGVHGHTITDARGHGKHGDRDALWPASANIRIEVLCDEQLAGVIAADLQARYYERYGMVIFIADVQVLRPGKF